MALAHGSRDPRSAQTITALVDEVRAGSTLQQRFLDLVGFTAAGEGSLAWLRSSSV